MEKSIVYKGTEISYTVSGEGKDLVFLHGFTESKEMWKDFEAYFSATHRVICIDLPGHGKSGMLSCPHTMEAMAEAVEAVLNAENVSRHLLTGHSLGGYVSLAYARLSGEKLSGFVLFHSTATADTPEIKQNRDRLIKLVEADKLDFINNFIPSLFAPESRLTYAAEIKELTAQSNRTSVKGIVAALKGMKQRDDNSKLLEELSAPVLFIAGKQDSRIAIEKILPQIALPRTSHALLLENVGHMGFIEAKDDCLRAIEMMTK